ncbi:MAG: DUF4405 domain-containing protein, partial [Chloroflexi bacterium]|nr:DUF4405 domain-containing protein [Chloroflexota bacterium]
APSPTTDQERMRLTLQDLLLHLHAPRVPKRAIKINYTFGLGVLSTVLFLTLAITGMLLMFVYTPTPDGAYDSMKALRSDIWLGQLVRNIHHWSANLMLILVTLHMLRVFYTAAFHHPREFNWILGLVLLVLVAMSNFTGYLMPWDQLSYWAVTIGTSMIEYIPVFGQDLSDAILGGPEVGAATLRTFFAFHVALFPFLIAVTVSYHLWRVRKDQITLPRDLDEPPPDRRKVERVTTVPHLVNLEIAGGLILLALLFGFSAFVDAPLIEAADPNHPPNPSKAAWYFMGVQELLMHFHPQFVSFVIPVLVGAALLLLPYLDYHPDRAPDVRGIWFRSRRGRRQSALAATIGVVGTVLLVIIDEFWLDLPDVFPNVSTLISNGVIPLVIPLIFLVAYYWLLLRRGATRTEANQALFTLLFMAFITLTVIGQFFRGENMALMYPWDV